MDSLSTEEESLQFEENSFEVTDSLNSLIIELGTKLNSSREKELVRKYGREIGNRISQGKSGKE